MFERALLLKARIQLLPLTHPASRLLEVAQDADVCSWASQVATLQTSPRFGASIPDILAGFPSELIREARASATVRRQLVAKYRTEVVRPVLTDYDRTVFERAASVSTWPYIVFQPAPDGLPEHETWAFYRAWACVRVLGRWPLAVFGAGGLPNLLELCPLCSEPQVEVQHLLSGCICTAALLRDWAGCVGHVRADPVGWTELARLLFAGRVSHPLDNPFHGEARVVFVGRCCAMAAQAVRDQSLDIDVEDADADAVAAGQA